MKKIILPFITLLLTTLVGCEKDVVYKPIPTEYSFFVAGHTYGQPDINNDGVHPPFKNKFDLIKEDPFIELGILTGDVVIGSTEENWDEIDTDFAELEIPFHIAPGNHDVTDRALFESRYGPPYHSFTQNEDLFIVLDPNIDQWNISGDQLTFLRDELNQKARNADNIFVFFHQILWWTPDNLFRNFRFNSNLGRAEHINFWNDVYPLFTGLNNEVYMFAGDCGAHSMSDPFMYYTSENVHLIASGMGGGTHDNFVIVEVGIDKSVSFKLIAINGNDVNALGNLEDYILP